MKRSLPASARALRSRFLQATRRLLPFAACLALLGCGDDPARREYFAALEASKHGRPLEESLAHIDRAIALHPDRAEYYETRAGFRRSLGHLDGAEADYDRAIELRDRAYLRFERANLLAARGEPERALADYDLAIALEAWNAQFYRGRALARAAVGRGAEALADAEHLVAESRSAPSRGTRAGSRASRSGAPRRRSATSTARSASGPSSSSCTGTGPGPASSSATSRGPPPTASRRPAGARRKPAVRPAASPTSRTSRARGTVSKSALPVRQEGMRQTFSTGRWARIVPRTPAPAGAIGDRWAPVLESVWASRLDALDARCAALGSVAGRLERTRQEARHGD